MENPWRSDVLNENAQALSLAPFCFVPRRDSLQPVLPTVSSMFVTPGGGGGGGSSRATSTTWLPKTVTSFYGGTLPRPFLLLDKTTGQVTKERMAAPKLNDALLGASCSTSARSRHRLSGSELAEAHSHNRATLPDWASSVPFRRGGLLDDNVRVAGRAAPRYVRRDEDDDDGAVRKKPKKARSAAMFYFLEHRAAHGGGVPFFQLKKLLMADYSKLSAEEQAKYVELAEGAFTALTRLCLCGCLPPKTDGCAMRLFASQVTRSATAQRRLHPRSWRQGKRRSRAASPGAACLSASSVTMTASQSGAMTMRRTRRRRSQKRSQMTTSERMPLRCHKSSMRIAACVV